MGKQEFEAARREIRAIRGGSDLAINQHGQLSTEYKATEEGRRLMELAATTFEETRRDSGRE